jgi:hypothetical protein
VPLATGAAQLNVMVEPLTEVDGVAGFSGADAQRIAFGELGVL